MITDDRSWGAVAHSFKQVTELSILDTMKQGRSAAYPVSGKWVTSKPPSLKPLLASGPVGTPAGFAESSRTKTASNAVPVVAEPLVEGWRTQFRRNLSESGDSSLAERMAGCKGAATSKC